MISNEYKHMFVGINTKVPLTSGGFSIYTNFDNAATTPPFKSVLQKVIDFMPWYSSIHRGKGYKSMLCSDLYDESRDIILDFVKADKNYHTVIYVKNTTEGINKLSYRLLNTFKNGVILSSSMEHHSNDLPWRDKYKIDYIDIDKLGRLSLEDLEKKLIQYNGSVKLVTITGASNVTGYKNPIHKIAKLAHQYNAQILVDAAQLIAHEKIDMKSVKSQEHIDYLVFSAHKMYAPFGCGVIVAPKYIFEIGNPEYCGGGTVDIVTKDIVKWTHVPEKEEAGTPNVVGVIALIEAITMLKQIGFNNIVKHEQYMLNYIIRNLKNISDILLYADCENLSDRLGIIPFNLQSFNHNIVAKILSDQFAIGVRNGCFCAQPYIQKLLDIDPNTLNSLLKNPNMIKPGMVRISFALYNDIAEIDLFLSAIEHILKNKKYYLKYR